MQIIAVSDTHGDAKILADILQRHPNLAGYFYAGDSELAAADPLFQTYQAVTGNMDFDPAFPETVTARVGSGAAAATVFMAHGHRYGVNFTMNDIALAGQAAGADLVIFGHTHELGVEQHAGMVLLNPGSISQPRGEFTQLGGTYAVVTIDATSITVEYRQRDGRVVPKLTRKFPRPQK